MRGACLPFILLELLALQNRMADSKLSVAVIDENSVRAAILVEGLQAAGVGTVTVIAERNFLLRRVAELNPDVVIIDLENPSRDVLEQMFQVSRVVQRPVAMFVDQSDSASIQASVDAGVSAYIVDGLRKERIRPGVVTGRFAERAFDASTQDNLPNLAAAAAAPEQAAASRLWVPGRATRNC